MDTPAFREFLKALLAEGALAALVIYAICVRQRLQARMWPLFIALVLIGAGAVASYYEFGWVRYGRFMNPHDFYHYYTGTKYAPELGYHNQYAASLLADLEGKKIYNTKQPIRNLATHGYTPVKDVLANKDAIKGRFTPERWEEFKKDIAYFQGLVPKAKWQDMLRDKGYNGTPVWSLFAGMLTNLVPTSSEAGMQFLVALDPLILLGMFLLIWRAFGPWCALFALAFFGTNFALAFVHIKGALMRMDWVACLVASMCLLHLKHYRSAGVVLAYAAAARIFPGIFAFGLGALLCWEFLATRKLNRDYVRFFAAFAVTGVLLTLAAYVYYGLPLWKEFFAKIGVHNDDISTTRVGFKYIFLWPYEGVAGKSNAFTEHQGLWRAIMAVALGLSFAAARRMKPWQAIGLGFVPAFFLTAPTFYYYVMLIVPLLIFLPRLELTRNAIGSGLFFAVTIISYALRRGGMELNFDLCFILSCLYLVLGLYIVGVHLLPRRESVAAAEGQHALVAPALSQVVPAPALATAEPSPTSEATPEVSKAPVPTAMPTPPKSRIEMRHILGVAYVCFLLGLLLFYRADDATRVPAPEAKPTRSESMEKEPAEESDSVEAAVPEPSGPAAAVSPAPVASAAPAAHAPDTVSIALVGDIMLSRNVAKDLATRNLDFTYPFKEAAPLLQAADIAFGNLECPISGKGEALQKKYVFNAPPEAVEGLQFAGFDLLSLANNHTLDYGAIALDDTLLILGNSAIPPLGIVTGNTPQQPVVIERKGLRIGFLGYADPESPYAYPPEFMKFEKRPARAEKEAVARDIAALKPNADVIIVSYHWGTEYQNAPSPQQVELGQYTIDQGADVVAGHHPHVQQDAAWYKDGLIIYSMGNFVFDQWSRPATLQSRLYTVNVNKDGAVDASYRPMELVPKDWQPRATGPQNVPVPKAAP
ncbi:MAG: CapA family protein [Candidatus Hydrogenedentes bacterium]|nr:CapA family protein [Candidatus Hydrogenedentota bacterium]